MLPACKVLVQDDCVLDPKHQSPCKEAEMWAVQRSDSRHSSSWATRGDARHYIGSLGVTARIARCRFDVRLANGDHITASMMPS